MKQSLKTIVAATALVGAASAAQAFDFTTVGLPAPSVVGPVVLAPGDTAVRTIVTDGSAKEEFSFNWTGVGAFITLESFGNPGTSYTFSSWEFGSGTTPGASILGSGSALPNGTFGPITLTSTLQSAGSYWYTFSGTDNSLTNSVTSRLTLATALPSVTAIPEPSTYALMLAGLGVVGFMARRRKVVSGQANLVAA